MNPLDGVFETVDEQDLKQKIVEELLNSEKNLEAKTELDSPIKWSLLNLLEDYSKTHQLAKSTSILKTFRETTFIYLISKKRQGRKEYIDALKSLSHITEEEKPINMLNPIAK